MDDLGNPLTLAEAPVNRMVPLPAFFILIADQLSKWGVMEHMIRPAIAAHTPSESPLPLSFMQWLREAPSILPYAEIEILPFFNIVMFWNRGISFGMFNEASDYGPLILIIVSIVITLFFLIWLFAAEKTVHRLGIALSLIHI